MGSGGIDPKINISQPTNIASTKGAGEVDKTADKPGLPSLGSDTASIAPKRTFADLPPEKQVAALLDAAKSFGLSPNASRIVAKNAFNKNQPT